MDLHLRGFSRSCRLDGRRMVGPDLIDSQLLSSLDSLLSHTQVLPIPEG